MITVTVTGLNDFLAEAGTFTNPSYFLLAIFMQNSVFTSDF